MAILSSENVEGQSVVVVASVRERHDRRLWKEALPSEKSELRRCSEAALIHFEPSLLSFFLSRQPVFSEAALIHFKPSFLSFFIAFSKSSRSASVGAGEVFVRLLEVASSASVGALGGGALAPLCRCASSNRCRSVIARVIRASTRFASATRCRCCRERSVLESAVGGGATARLVARARATARLVSAARCRYWR